MRQTMTKIHTDKDKVFMRDRVQPMPNAAQKKIAFQAARDCAWFCRRQMFLYFPRAAESVPCGLTAENIKIGLWSVIIL